MPASLAEDRLDNGVLYDMDEPLDILDEMDNPSSNGWMMTPVHNESLSFLPSGVHDPYMGPDIPFDIQADASVDASSYVDAS